MAKTTIAIFERTLRWTPELQRQFLDENVQIRGLANLTDEVFVQKQNKINVIVIVLANAETQCLQFLGRMANKQNSPAIIVVGTPQTQELEWTARELGVSHFVSENFSSEEMADICRKLASCH